MGLIKAAIDAVGGTLSDQWEDLIKCEDMGNDTLMVKQTTKSGQISKNSRIIVAPGQCAVIYDSGKVLDATAEEGTYTFDASSSPTFFAGQFGDVFKEMWQRFTYGGKPAKEQAVFYFNLKEIKDNKFGTGTPIPFQDWSHPIPNQMTGTMTPLAVKVRCYGVYTFKIADPATFMRNHAGTADKVDKEEITEQMRSEVIASFQNVLNELGTSKHKTPVLELPSNTDEIKETMDSKVFDKPIRERGLQIVGFAVESVSLDDASQEKIDNYELSSNGFMQQGSLVGSYGKAIKDAANNPSGAGSGVLGVGMMNMASGGMIAGTAAGAFKNGGYTTGQTVDPFGNAVDGEGTVQGVPCPKCGNPITGKFCAECGVSFEDAKKALEEEPEGPTCPKCGAAVGPKAKFCPECGEKLEG